MLAPVLWSNTHTLAPLIYHHPYTSSFDLPPIHLSQCIFHYVLDTMEARCEQQRYLTTTVIGFHNTLCMLTLIIIALPLTIHCLLFYIMTYWFQCDYMQHWLVVISVLWNLCILLQHGPWYNWYLLVTYNTSEIYSR